MSAGENAIIQAYEIKFLELRKKETDLNNLAKQLQEKQDNLAKIEADLNQKQKQISEWEKKLNKHNTIFDLKIMILSSLIDFINKKIELFYKIISSFSY